MSRFDSLVIVLGNLIGARIFKKYWFMGGSVWNGYHTNSKSISDLTTIKTHCKLYAAVHLNVAFFQTIYIVMLYKFSEIDTNTAVSSFLAYIFHAYTLIMQRYNYILANRAIEKILSTPSSIDEHTDNSLLKIQSTNGGYYVVDCCYKLKCPILASKAIAQDYMNYILSQSAATSISQLDCFLFTHDHVDMFKKFNERNK